MTATVKPHIFMIYRVFPTLADHNGSLVVKRIGFTRSL